MKNNLKKFRVFILVFCLVILSSCQAQSSSVVPNAKFVDAFENTNNYLLDQSGDISGQVLINVSAGVKFEGSNAEIGVDIANTRTDLYYDANLSASTIQFLLEQLTGPSAVTTNSLIGNYQLYSVDDSVNITKGKSNVDNVLSFNSKSLNKIYSGNKLYFSNDANKKSFGESLNKYNTTSSINVVADGDKTKSEYVTTMTVPANEVVNIIPFVDLSTKLANQNIVLTFYQDKDTSLIYAIDINIVNYTFTDSSGVIYVNGDFTLHFDLPVGGTQ